MVGKKPKSRHLTVYLLPGHVKRDQDALAKPNTVQKFAIRGGLGLQGTLFVKPATGKHPAWLDFLSPNVQPPLAAISNSNTSAVLILRAGGRRFAFTFGFGGRFLLKPDSWEPDFGLRVTLNAVNPDQLRAVDVKTIHELTLHTRRQVSRASGLETFGLDVSQDLLRGVTGEPRDRQLASRVTGADGLVFSGRLEFRELKEKSERFLDLFTADTYRERFGWIDELKALRTGTDTQKLDSILVDDLRARNIDRTHLSPKEPLDWDQAAEFSYSTAQAAEPSTDLAIEDYLDTLEDANALSLEDLKSHRVLVRQADQEDAFARWSVYSCVVYETELEGKLCVLSGGQWFRVEKTLLEAVDADVNRIGTAALALPAAAPKDGEDEYIARVGATHKNIALMHKRLARSIERRAPIEICDLFTEGRQFVHIKSKTKSATLSHLFAQGLVSADALLWDAGFRKEATKYVAATSAALADLIPEQAVTASDFEIVYAIIAKPTVNVPKDLPFFSRLHLGKVGEQLRRRGFRVSVLRIDRP